VSKGSARPSALIAGTGSALPEGRLTNADLEQLVETNDQWIVERTGIRERGRIDPDEATSHLAVRAAKGALESTGIAPEDLDLIVVCTVSPDMLTPSTACLVHRDLHVGKAVPCFDIGAACSGFLYGLEVVCDLIGAGRYQRALLVGAETITKFVDYEDRGTCVLFGDAAGAAVLEASDRPGGVISSVLKSDGEFWDLIHIPVGSAHPPTPEMLAQRAQYLRMNGRQVFKLAVQALEQVSRDALDRAGWKLDEVDHLLFHQANLRIIEAVGSRLRAPAEKIHLNIDRTGNTSAATIPTLMDEVNRAGKLAPGDKILCAAFGAGLTWAATTIEWTAPRFEPAG
jgi:3-oxoacyl-[acyl-carrier-protein] synthase-3